MFTSQDVTVIIPAYNSAATIAACLRALQMQTTPPGEIIVADSSKDETPDIIRDNFPQVRLTRFNNQTFPGPARNRAAGMARGDILAFIDADCLAAPDWVERIVAAHNAGHEIAGGSLEVGNAEKPIAWAGHMLEFREFLPIGPPRPVIHIPTCNLSYRKRLFQEFGGFPNAYYPQEDLLFNYLLNQRGHQVWFDPAIHIYHFYRDTWGEFLPHQHRIGRVTRCSLARLDLPGRDIARRPWLAWLSAPLLGTVKFLRSSTAFLRKYPAQAARMPHVLLIIALGAVWWGRGFASGARTGLSGIRGWDAPLEDVLQALEQRHED